MFDVITIGSATIDVFVHTDGLFRPCKKCPGHVKVPFGSKILIKDLNFFTGGGATNAAVGFSRLGFRTAWIGKLGDDETGAIVLKEMKKEKVDTSFVKILPGGKSGYSIILDASGHDRTILTHKGCNDLLENRDVALNKVKAKLLYASTMLGDSLKTLEKVVNAAKSNKTKIAFNPSCYMIENYRKDVVTIVKKTDILVFNTEEAGLLVGNSGIVETIRKIHALGPGIVVVTDGSRGAFASDGNEVWHCKAPKAKVVEATGAGDSFATGFCAGVLKGLPVGEAMKLGMAEAGSVISHLGAKNILMTWKQAKSAVKKIGRASLRRIA